MTIPLPRGILLKSPNINHNNLGSQITCDAQRRSSSSGTQEREFCRSQRVHTAGPPREEETCVCVCVCVCRSRDRVFRRAQVRAWQSKQREKSPVPPARDGDVNSTRIGRVPRNWAGFSTMYMSEFVYGGLFPFGVKRASVFLHHLIGPDDASSFEE
jgi:hypothetical protein